MIFQGGGGSGPPVPPPSGSALVEDVRQHILKRILQCAEYLMRSPIDSENLVQLLLDSAGDFTDPKDIKVQTTIINIEKLAKRLCLILHTERYKRLNLVPKRNRKRMEKVAVVHSSVNSNSIASSSDTTIGQTKRKKETIIINK